MSGWEVERRLEGPRNGQEASAPPPYADPATRGRMVEYLGGEDIRTATAVYVQGWGERPDSADPPRRRPAALPDLLECDCEVVRSLWDRRSLVAHLDVEYVNFDFPGEAYLDPHRTFGLQRPVVRAIRTLLGLYRIAPLHLRTGRGHHFVWTVDRGSLAFRRLEGLGRVPGPLAAAYAARHPPRHLPVDPALGRAFAGLGLVMEYLGHLVRYTAGPESPIPVELSEVAVGPPARGLEIVAVDLSEYGDALHTRRVILPFSRYLKPSRMRNVIGEHVERGIPPTWVILDPGLSDWEAVRRMRDAESVSELARETHARMPEHGTEMENLISDYEGSELSQFHDYFYAEEHEPPERWPLSYDRTPIDELPPAVADTLRHPNDRLLRPTDLLRVVEVFLERGWHPRHIAGLIRSRYERDYGWGARWYQDNATCRADYYTRLFAGTIALGRGTPHARRGTRRRRRRSVGLRG